jgi:hypothetical protein
MTKFQYMVLIVALIFLILTLIIFGIFVKMTFTEEKLKKKKAPCPDYWEEVKDASVVDVYPNKEYIYIDKTGFTPGSISPVVATIGNNAAQDIQIMLDKDSPFIRITNENTKKINACKVPIKGKANTGTIYENTDPYSLKLRNYRYGPETNRKNYTTIYKISQTGAQANITYNKKDDSYSIDPSTNSVLVNVGDPIVMNSVIKTPGFYWGTECVDGGNACLKGRDNGNIKIWGKSSYTPSNYYIDFEDNDWHAINMNKSKLCNLKDWANRNGIVWDGVTNIEC